MRIYLSGSVKEIEYRKEVKEKYSTEFEIKDPLEDVEKRLIDPKELDILKKLGFSTFDKDVIDKIVEGDIELIKECECLVVLMNIYSAGTIMEIRIAYDLDIPVYIIDPAKTMRSDVWLIYHTNLFFNDIDTCFNFLKNTYN